MKKLIYTLFLIFLFSSNCFSKDKYKNIGVLFDGDWWRNSELVNQIKTEIDDLAGSDFDYTIDKKNILSGQWNKNIIKKNINALLANEEIDIIIVLGIISSECILEIGKYSKPVVTPFFKGIKGRNIVEDGKSTLENLNLIYLSSSFESDIIALKNAFQFKNLTILINELLKDYYKITPSIKQFFNQNNINFNVVYIKDEINEVVKNISKNSEAVYVSPQSILNKEEFYNLSQSLTNKKVKGFYALGTIGVKMGMLATNRNPFLPKLARRIGLNVQRIVLGDKPEKIPVQFYHEENLTINMETAESIDFYPGWNLLNEAELINEPEELIEYELSLGEVIKSAVKVNLDILANKHSVKAGNESVNEALSNLLPQIDLFATGLMIDKDRAESSFGSQPEKLITGSIKATQLIYSEKSWANYSIQKSLQKKREAEFEQAKFDIALEAGKTFLNLLKAEAYVRIQKDNLDKVKSNLSIAHIREKTGSGGPAEVYRWESELAKSRIDLIKAKANRKTAMVAVNRILHKPLNRLFKPVSANVYVDRLINLEELIPKYMGNRKSLAIFEDYIIQRGQKNSVELKQIESIYEAKDRMFSSSLSSFWSPTIALQGELGYNFSKSGAGSGGMDFTTLPPEQQFLSNLFPPQPDDMSWSIALNLSFPLFHGTKKFSQKNKAQAELDEIKLQKKSVSDKVEQQIRSMLYLAGASYSAIRQSKLRAEAASKSLKVITEAYSRGAISIIELLDAQNVYELAQESSSNSVYDFLIDLMNLERAASEFFILMNEDEQQNYLNKLEEFYSDYKYRGGIDE